MKAIFEIDMPESCNNCILSKFGKPMMINGENIALCVTWCRISGEFVDNGGFDYTTERSPNCPLKFSADRDYWKSRAEMLERALKMCCEDWTNKICKNYLGQEFEGCKNRKGFICSNWQFDEARFAADEPEKGEENS